MIAKNSNIVRPSEEIRTLRLLDELERNSIVSQRLLSQKFGISLGLTNAYLKRMVTNGWIRTQGLNRRRMEYFLTPKGKAEKTRLTLTLISSNVQHYSELKKIIHGKFVDMQRKGKKRIVFYGVSDEMEVAYISLQGVDLNLVGIVEDDEKFQSQIILGYELEPVSRIQELKPDGVLITCIKDNEKRRERLRALLGTKRIHVSDICA